ncbi:MAG: methionine synthase [Anaerolineae bacterium]|jgi:hypothetical protein
MSAKEQHVPFEPGWYPFALGSLPHTDVGRAWELVWQRFLHIPGWPQLPRRSYLENMYVQFSERFPGIVLDDRTAYVSRDRDLGRDLEQLYLAYLENDLEHGRIGGTYAAGLERLRRGGVVLSPALVAMRGQVTGPVSWGLTTVDENQRPILYDEILADAVGKHLRLKAAWQERELQRTAPHTIMMIEEPYMASFGSSFVALRRNQVIGLLEEVFSGLQGIKGIHCCGNTDWSILLNTSVDILSLDAYDYGRALVRYAEDVTRFLERGGIIAWGIVPAGMVVESENVETLVARLHRTIDRLVEAGVPREAILKAGMITPSCGLAALTPALAERIYDLTVGVAREMRRRYMETSPDDEPDE